MVQTVFVLKSENSKRQILLGIYLAVFLAASYKTILVDGYPENHIIENSIALRHCLNLKNSLTLPAYSMLKKNLTQEMMQSNDFVIAVADENALYEKADIIITLLTKQTNLDELTQKESAFNQMLWNAKIRRAKVSKNAIRHILLPTDDADLSHISDLQKNASMLGYQIAPQINFNNIDCEVFKTGITVLDKDMPFLKQSFNRNDFFARRNLKQIFEFIWSR